jgi:chromosome segregation ATPase
MSENYKAGCNCAPYDCYCGLVPLKPGETPLQCVHHKIEVSRPAPTPEQQEIARLRARVQALEGEREEASISARSALDSLRQAREERNKLRARLAALESALDFVTEVRAKEVTHER